MGEDVMNIGDMKMMAEVPLSWEMVPSGALARVLPDTQEFRLGHVVRHGDFGQWVDARGNIGRCWKWSDGDWGGLVEQIQIVALGLTGTETADELLGYMTAQVPSVDPLIQAWSLRHCRGRRLSFGPGEVRSAFRPIEKRCVCG